MNAGRDVERLIADWFVEEAVLRAPDRVLEATGRAIDQLQRRPSRLPWRNPTMTRFAFLGAAAVLVAAVGVAGLALTSRNPGPDVGGPSPTPRSSQPVAVPTPSSSVSTPAPLKSADLDVDAIPAMTERTSPRPDGVSIGYPTGWTVEDNGVRWWENGEPDSHSIVWFEVKSSDLGASETPAEWVAARASEDSGGISMTCPRTAVPTEMTIGSGDRRGIVLKSNCSYGGNGHHFLAVLVEGSRGYTFHMDTPRQDGRAWFEALLANVEFDEAAF